MGKLAQSALEVRLAATLFLLLIGVADFFGAWQVKNFSAFTPSGVAATVGAFDKAEHEGRHHVTAEMPIDLSMLNAPRHRYPRELLVQDTHVHVPVYAMTAAFLSLLVFGLRLSSKTRTALVGLAFAAPFVDFIGLWGAHLFAGAAPVWAAVALVGGFLMGIVYLVVFLLTWKQCWFRRKGKYNV